jgi:hypothetical protein
MGDNLKLSHSVMLSIKLLCVFRFYYQNYFVQGLNKIIDMYPSLPEVLGCF